MKSIKLYARLLEVFCWVVVIPSMVLFSILKWIGSFSLFGASYYEFPFLAQISYSYEVMPKNLPFLSKILAIFVDSISVGLFLFGLVSFILVLRCYQKGKMFTFKTFSLFRRLSRVAFVWVLYEPVRSVLMSLIVTFHKPAGQRAFLLTLSSNDVFNFFIVVFFLIITSLMYEGYKLQHEQDLTV